MRTFHIGGAASVADKSDAEAAHDSRVEYVNPQVVKRADGRFIVVGRHMEVNLFDGDGRLRQTFKPTYGTRLHIGDGGEIKRGEKLADWDPFAQPIVSEYSGTVKFEDVIDGQTAREDTDEATGISSRSIVDFRAGSRGPDLRPSVVLLDGSGQPVKGSNGQDVRYQLPVGAILSVGEGDRVGPGDTLARITTGGAKARDITGGLPRVAELFEARRPKDHAILADFDGRIEFGRDFKNKRRIKLIPDEDTLEPTEHLVAKGRPLLVQDGDHVKRGDPIVDGNPAPQDILAILGVEALADYLVEEIQKVYRLQGVPINDKHIEVIVRQMLQKIEITDSGETTLLKGEHVDQPEFIEVNAAAEKAGRLPAKGVPVLLGITKASLQTRSFISAASFQETTRVLTEAAIQGKVDTLEGLKENVIVGRLIPAGTGGQLRRYRRIAADRDTVLKARRAASTAATLPRGPGGVKGAE
jgi:DNA-directed RNA polymerase subunit beta'